jgi:hypothetical protein
MRPELLEPRGPLTTGILVDLLGLVGVTVPLERAETWTKLELALAYDWAAREHMRASDDPIRRREQPSFLSLAAPSEHDSLVAKLRTVHTRYRIYESCTCPQRDDDDHLNVELDDGEWTCEASYAYSICTECCCDRGDEQTELCSDGHTHGPDLPICQTRAIIDSQVINRG